MSILKISRLVLFGLAALFSTVTLAHDRQPFLHEFGELRAYFSDWLVVCDDWGNGACRAVYYVLGEDGYTFFGESVLRLHRANAEAQIEFEFYDAGAPDPLGIVKIEVDDRRVASLAPGADFGPYMANGQAQVAETIQINNQRYVDRIVAAMKAGRYLNINYQRTADERKQVSISLRGLSAALGFIDRQMARQ